MSMVPNISSSSELRSLQQVFTLSAQHLAGQALQYLLSRCLCRNALTLKPLNKTILLEMIRLFIYSQHVEGKLFSDTCTSFVNNMKQNVIRRIHKGYCCNTLREWVLRKKLESGNLSVVAIVARVAIPVFFYQMLYCLTDYTYEGLQDRKPSQILSEF